MTQRIAFVRNGDCAVCDALERLHDVAPFEWKRVDVRDPARVRESMSGCDLAFTLFETEADFSQVLRAPHDGLPRMVLDFSPISPATFSRAQRELAQSGVELLGAQAACGADAACHLPEPGSSAEDSSRTRLYADSALQCHTDILELLRRATGAIHFTGAGGTSKAMATIEHLLFAVSCAASTEALALATQAGLDAQAMRELLAKGSGANEVLASGAACLPGEGVQFIARGQELARTHEHALPVSTAAKVLHQWAGAAS